jgi:hypothetical protein
LLINVGTSFKQSYRDQLEGTPGPGAYTVNNVSNQKSKLIGYKWDNSKRSDLVAKCSADKLGPGSYNVVKDKYQSTQALAKSSMVSTNLYKTAKF